uniref:Uncharacterized protein n=1 Tax=Rhipicephalus microplus TaxID=6941 RepID=A0A6M2DC69_RHIMP
MVQAVLLFLCFFSHLFLRSLVIGIRDDIVTHKVYLNILAAAGCFFFSLSCFMYAYVRTCKCVISCNIPTYFYR